MMRKNFIFVQDLELFFSFKRYFPQLKFMFNSIGIDTASKKPPTN